MAPPESLHDVQKLMGVYGCPEKVHLTTRRQGAHFLQAPQKIGQVLVYQRSTRVFRGPQEVLDYPTHRGGSRTLRNLTTLHIDYKQCG
jgi:hypothetical protein